MTPEEFLKQKAESHPVMFDSFGREHHFAEVYIDDAKKAVEMAREEVMDKVCNLIKDIFPNTDTDGFRKLIHEK